MRPLKKCTATKALRWLLVLALVAAGAAYAGQPVGTVTDVNGPLLVRKADGTVKALSQKSTVDQGDTLVSEKDTYARIKFIDKSEITLKPNTQFKIENYAYEEAKPENDSAIFGLVKGGLRSITGLLGKRSKERFGLNTPTATIGIRGTIFIAEYVPPAQSDIAAYQAAALASLASDQLNWGLPSAGAVRTDAPQDFLPGGVLGTLNAGIASQPTGEPHLLQLAQNAGGGGSDGRSPGLYVQVLDGAIHLTNGGGTQNFAAGQFGFTGGFKQPPIILPTNPGMQFTPPPAFSSSAGTSGGTGGAKPGNVDCVVR